MSLMLAATREGVVAWRPHPEVWVLVAGAIALAFYAVRVIQPAAVAAGYPAITRSQKVWFVLAAVGLWLTSDWPVHDVAEEQLYAVHMTQHMILSMVLPAMFLLATPRWLVQLVIPEGSRIWNVLRWSSRAVVAGLAFNVLTAALHITGLVHLSLAVGPIHFGLHLLVFLSGLLMWMPVCGPVEEWRLSPPGQMVYLFAMSIFPTVPGGWLVFAENVVYRDYDTPARLWGISALQDQQVAGMVMKIGGGLFLWAVIIFLFFRWAAGEERERDALARSRRIPSPNPSAQATPPVVSDLTYDDVAKAFARSGPPPTSD